MQNNLLDYKQDEQSIKKVIEKEINGKSKRLFDPNTYYSQFQNLTSESLQQCEKSQAQKGAKEMIEFKAQVTSQDKVIEAIRAANFVEIQNVNFKFKRLLKEILQQIADQLGNLFKDEYLKLWLEWKSAKAALMDKEVKLKNSEMSQQLQEQELIQIRTEFTAQNTFLSMNKQLEATVQNLETENNKLKDSLKNLNQYCNELKQNNEELNKRMKKLEQQFEEAKEKYENEINQLKLKEQNLIRANKDLIDLNNQLTQQLDKYRDLYEMQNQKNNDLADQVRYWKSTHQQRLTDLQQSETRIGSQKGYLFKYRREVQDLKRFKLYSEEAQKELSNARQTVHLLNQQTEQLKFSYENAIQQNLQIQTEKTENLNQILLRNAQSTKKVNNETNVFYESPQKSKFDFHSVKKITQPSVDELSQFVISYSKVPIQSRRTKVRSVSAQKNSQSETDTSKNNIGIQEFDQFTPYTESNVNQLNFNSAPKHPLSKNKRIKRQNTES
ncbi:unnamed protein product (macronuclear) [Paramecium tetraurelia]|uniref:Uncharacterized protein n=1 Tax=Paramecium tetraurelia TaxID=5888 RepID=A0BTG5_PARTE|nr:uncharacterized protein GSPATT00032064001 [Paramecium tetraurelia]CAK61832.1 unnamed protein product [Paramecium tetraurelia]|eukprot:XP_001429230.1 hypothetical protein (macronuclear) [Paramecium tetraurelia strain d4-2]